MVNHPSFRLVSGVSFGSSAVLTALSGLCAFHFILCLLLFTLSISRRVGAEVFDIFLPDFSQMLN